MVALLRTTRPTRYQVGDVYYELHFFRNAGAGHIVDTISLVAVFSLLILSFPSQMHLPMMDTVIISALLYRLFIVSPPPSTRIGVLAGLGVGASLAGTAITGAVIYHHLG